jgi:hypothetical protein
LIQEGKTQDQELIARKVVNENPQMKKYVNDTFGNRDAFVEFNVNVEADQLKYDVIPTNEETDCLLPLIGKGPLFTIAHTEEFHGWSFAYLPTWSPCMKIWIILYESTDSQYTVRAMKSPEEQIRTLLGCGANIFIQLPGERIFVPTRALHAVILFMMKIVWMKCTFCLVLQE